MSADVQPFDNGEFHLDMTVTPDGSFTVQAPGLAKALGIREAYNLLRSIPESEKGSSLVRTPGGDQRVGYVTEAGFYRAIGQRQAARIADDSIRAMVERFQSWVYGEVLPSIRRTGSYGAARELTGPELMARALVEAQAVLAAKEERIAVLEPSARAWHVLAQASGDLSLRGAAQVLSRDPAIETGQNRLAATLREIGWVDRNGEPYQKAIDAGYVKRRVLTYDHPRTGRPTSTTQVRITAKGLAWLHRYLGGVAALRTGEPMLEVTS